MSEATKQNEGLILYTGFEEAFLGTAFGCGQVARACYDRAKCIEILMRDMSHEEAEEYFEFNVIGGYVGERTPMFLHPMTIEQAIEEMEEYDDNQG